MSTLFGRDHAGGDRRGRQVKGHAHRVPQLEPPRSLLELEVLVVRERDGIRGHGGGLARIGNGVVHPYAPVEARNLQLVGVGNGQPGLQLWQQRCHAVEAGAAVPVLEEEDALVGGLSSEQRVLVFLDRADDQVDRGVLHVEPGELARAVVVSQEGVRAKLEVCAERGVVGHLGRLAEERRGLLDVMCERLVIGDGDEPALAVPANDGMRAAECGGSLRGLGARGLEFDHVHVGRIEARHPSGFGPAPGTSGAFPWRRSQGP